MADALRPDWSGRLDRIQTSLVPEGLDGFVVSTSSNLTYLTGFVGSAGLLLLTPDRRSFVIDGRYDFAVREAVALGTMADVIVERVERRYDLTLGEAVIRMGLRRVAFESAQVTVSNLSAWQRATPGVDWVPREGLIERPRMIKDAVEIAAIRRGAAALAGVVANLPQIIGQRRTEQEIADRLDAAIKAAGFARLAFPTIVASGPNSAQPHAHPSTRRVAAGDLVLLDFGGVLDGYCVDLTRMAAAGPVAPQASALFASVRDAHAAAIRAVRPGIDTSAIDTAARSVLDARGLGDAFLHATGHGLGLDVHEAPRIGRPDPDLTTTVEAGMVFTIEPGAYVEGVGGVRLEDDVLVTAEGCEVLTNVPRDLLVV